MVTHALSAFSILVLLVLNLVGIGGAVICGFEAVLSEYLVPFVPFCSLKSPTMKFVTFFSDANNPPTTLP